MLLSQSNREIPREQLQPNDALYSAFQRELSELLQALDATCCPHAEAEAGIEQQAQRRALVDVIEASSSILPVSYGP